MHWLPVLRGVIDRRILVNFRLDGVEFATDEWRVTPLAVESVDASFFEDNLPDDALLMRDIGHEWHQTGSMAPAARERA